jgi:allantoinase
MPGFDLIVHRGRNASGQRVDVAISDGVIAALEPELDPSSGAAAIDAQGLTVLPGGVDPHVHFNEPGRTEWEGWASGTSALAAGGITACCEMPLNAHPPTISAEAFDSKRAAAAGVARIDFGLWGGVVPGNAAALPELAARGVIGFKAFMSDSGVADFPASDGNTLREAMEVLAALPERPLLAVHAESDEMTRAGAEAVRAELAAAGGGAGRAATLRDWAASRPVAAETTAIAEAIGLAVETGCPLHIVHVSSGAGVALVADARRRGVDVSCEVTAHHLVLTEQEGERLGAIAKCAPPLRPAAETDSLWRALAAGEASFVVSDHSPCPEALKQGDAFEAWGGIAGGQSTLELVVSAHGSHGLPAAALARALGGGAAARLQLTGKGSLSLGADGDLALVRIGARRMLSREDLRDRHRLSPYVGRWLSAEVVCAVLRGRVISHGRAAVGEPIGRLLTPQNPSRKTSL